MNDNTVKKLIAASASVIVGYTLKQLAQKKWKDVYDEEPPTTHPSEEINWKKVIIWSVVTGTVISSAKLATKRYLTHKLDA
ncbi:hypothetical protein CK503_02420 [Aliifodinibius salipaludis]|uniref:DUF4235 domain-containing protein n=1 Tax=Fodinibius salipaludis TaxID=2032627 RepID=A0A2A2GDV5_9BACT|nr:DUF4235 domain-containing protein [Aliifodinibius salipaludis]PAU95073.1 hypothetical protein CK503_02420 [Aliifodinibius salipaludis]